MKREEDQIQINMLSALKKAIPTRALIVFVPNGVGNISQYHGNKLNEMGLHTGHPDLNIYYENKVYFIEVKKPKGTMTKKQEEFQEWAKKNNYPHAICRSVDDAIEAVKGWGLAEARIIENKIDRQALKKMMIDAGSSDLASSLAELENG